MCPTFFPQQEVPLPFQIKVSISFSLKMTGVIEAAVVGQVSEGQESLYTLIMVDKQARLGRNKVSRCPLLWQNEERPWL